MKNRLLYILLFALSAMFYACSDYDSYSTDPSFQLVFSDDTVRFDTFESPADAVSS